MKENTMDFLLEETQVLGESLALFTGFVNAKDINNAILSGNEVMVVVNRLDGIYKMAFYADAISANLLIEYESVLRDAELFVSKLISNMMGVETDETN